MNKNRVNITFNPRRRRRQKIKKLTASIVLGGAAYSLFFIAFMNFMFFPDCNRVTRDCFVVGMLWGAHE